MSLQASEPQINLVFENNDFLVINKPYGYRVHRVNPMQWGLLETLESLKNCKLWPVHRLDKDTSGLLIFAKTKEASQIFFELFEKNQVKKKYIFLTDKKIKPDQITFESLIEKFDDFYMSKKSEEPNSKTVFKRLSGAQASMTLWQAEPQSGKPHQIRLHAKDNGIAIMGDTIYSGTEHDRMALHAISLSFNFQNQDFNFETPFPLSFESRDTALEALLLSSKENIGAWIDLKNTNCYQLAQTSRRNWTIELLDNVYWIKNYGVELSDQEKINLFSFAKKYSCKIFVRTMKDRGAGVGGEEKDLLFSTDSELTTWTVLENGIQFELRSDSGFSTGLFLDQKLTSILEIVMSSALNITIDES